MRHKQIEADKKALKERLEREERERLKRVGEDFNYFPLLGDRDPPLDYRN